MGSNIHTRPPWTRDEARAFAVAGNVRKKELAREREAANARRIAELEAELADALARIPTGDDARRQKTLSQIDSLDELINRALDRKDSDEFIRLSSAKEKLWKLVQTVPGQAKRRTGRDAAPPIPTPQEAERVSLADPQKPG